ncbi:MAG TPA: hypothetical protein PKL53_03565 [Methylotenera sp.]|nr:hypothetical protein [Methylotenera sp.]HPV45083.1 hypothetical protein [Methylotenera sp.]
MNNLSQKLETISLSKLQFQIVVLSLMIAAQVQYIQHGWINPDSVLYLEAAKLFAKGEWQAGFSVFPWPLYSLCIVATHKFTFLSIHHAAQLLNVVFFGIATASFLKIIQLAGGKQRQIIAGALIWLSAQYMIGGVLEMLMRDEGFWAFYLTSLVFFIRFYKTDHFKDALLWQLCIMLATLFRIEAILFLLLLPLILLLKKQGTFTARLVNLFKCNVIHFALAFIVIMVFVTNKQLSTAMLGRLNEVFTSNIIHEFTRSLVEKSHIMSTLVLGKYLEEFAMQGLLFTFIYIIFVKAIAATGIVNIGLAGFAIKHQKQLIETDAYRVLSTAAIIALINMGLIITKVFVLSGRYVLALSFVLMVFATFYLAELFKYLTQNNKQKKWLVIGLIIIMLLGTIKNLLPKQEGYNYQQDAIAWLSEQNKSNKPVFYEDSRMRYFAGAPYIGTGIYNWELLATEDDSSSTNNYEYLVINHSTQHPEKEKMIAEKLSEYHEVNRFSSANSKKSIVIYQK